MGNWSDEETTEPLIADHRNFYKVEKWTKVFPPRPRAAALRVADSSRAPSA